MANYKVDKENINKHSSTIPKLPSNLFKIDIPMKKQKYNVKQQSKGPFLQGVGPINFQDIKQSMIKAVVPEVVRALHTILKEIVISHN